MRESGGKSEVLKALVKEHLPAIDAARQEDAEMLEEGEEGEEDAAATATGGEGGLAQKTTADGTLVVGTLCSKLATLRGKTIKYDDGTMIQKGKVVKEAWGTGPRGPAAGGGTLVMIGTGPYSRKRGGAEEHGTMAVAADGDGSKRPAYMSQFAHGAEPGGASAPGGSGGLPDIYTVNAEEASKKSPEELEAMVQELDEGFRRDMGALTQKYDRARSALVDLLEPEQPEDEDGGAEDGDSDGGIYG